MLRLILLSWFHLRHEKEGEFKKGIRLYGFALKAGRYRSERAGRKQTSFEMQFFLSGSLIASTEIFDHT